MDLSSFVSLPPETPTGIVPYLTSTSMTVPEAWKHCQARLQLLEEVL